MMDEGGGVRWRVKDEVCKIKCEGGGEWWRARFRSGSGSGSATLLSTRCNLHCSVFSILKVTCLMFISGFSTFLFSSYSTCSYNSLPLFFYCFSKSIPWLRVPTIHSPCSSTVLFSKPIPWLLVPTIHFPCSSTVFSLFCYIHFSGVCLHQH